MIIIVHYKIKFDCDESHRLLFFNESTTLVQNYLNIQLFYHFVSDDIRYSPKARIANFLKCFESDDLGL